MPVTPKDAAPVKAAEDGWSATAALFRPQEDRARFAGYAAESTALSARAAACGGRSP